MNFFWETYRFDVCKRACHQIFKSSQAGHLYAKYTNAHVVYQLSDRVLFCVGAPSLAYCAYCFVPAVAAAAAGLQLHNLTELKNGFSLCSLTLFE
jgi:hypothetical protein